MSRKGTWTQLHIRHLSKRWLQSANKLCLQLVIQLALAIRLGYIATYVGVEQNRIGNAIRILTVTTNSSINIQTDVVIYYTERNRIGGSELVINDFLGIKIINALVLTGISAHCKTLCKCLEGCSQAVT